MGFTKTDKSKFLERCDISKGYMPVEAIIRQTTLFDDVISIENKNGRWVKLHFALLYPPLDNNPEGNPIPKQSARFGVKRYLKDDDKGNKKGDPIVYLNKYGRKDVLITSYPETKIVKTTELLKEQLIIQIEKNYPDFTKFRGAIFITRLEMIFAPLSTFSNTVMNDLKTGTKIYFKDTKPDLDNLEKLVYDALEGIIYDNDARIVGKNGIFKRYGIKPGIIIEMEGEV